VDVVWIVVGLALLIGGGELVVRGASRLALALGMSPLAVGLTVVAAATSAPELAASLTAAAQGSPAVAIGNVVGSNVANIGLILGIAGLVREIPVKATFLRREVVVLVIASGALALVVADGRVGRLEGGALLGALVAYVAHLLRTEQAVPAEVEQEYVEEYGGGVRAIGAHLAVTAVGVGLLVGGAQALVTGAVSLARALGVAEEVIGLTVVAVGTSLPELASSVVAAWRGHGDLVLGNVVGSNIFNVLGILGLTALAVPIELGEASFGTDLVVMGAYAVVLGPMLFVGWRLRRWESALLLTSYLAYVGWVFTG
jgi:cation:H+ antiporter